MHVQHTRSNTRNTAGVPTGGRGVAEFKTLISREIRSGGHESGGFLPAVRELSRMHGFACSTVHRALRTLVGEGLLVAEPRQGFRVAAGAADPDRGCPLAYVFSRVEYGEVQGHFEKVLLAGFQEAAARRGWTLLSALAGPGETRAVVEKLRAGRAAAAIVDTNDPAMIEEFARAGLPVVGVNGWHESPAADSVVQDGQLGGLQAAAWLVGRGHRRVAWFGMTNWQGHTLDRLSGALAGLGRAGLAFEPDLFVDGWGPEAGDRARALLSRRDRPAAILALWQDSAAALARAARELALVPGRDFEMVGWARREDFAETYAANFAPGPVPPAAVWSVATMAEAAVSRLAERRRNPGMPALRIRVPTELRTSGS